MDVFMFASRIFVRNWFCYSLQWGLLTQSLFKYLRTVILKRWCSWRCFPEPEEWNLPQMRAGPARISLFSLDPCFPPLGPDPWQLCQCLTGLRDNVLFQLFSWLPNFSSSLLPPSLFLCFPPSFPILQQTFIECLLIIQHCTKLQGSRTK